MNYTYAQKNILVLHCHVAGMFILFQVFCISIDIKIMLYFPIIINIIIVYLFNLNKTTKV